MKVILQVKHDSELQGFFWWVRLLTSYEYK